MIPFDVETEFRKLRREIRGGSGSSGNWSSGQVISIMDHGGVGGGSDDTAAAMAAMAAAADGDTIFLPGIHRIEDLTVTKSLRFLSDSTESAVTHETAGTNIFKIAGSGLSVSFEMLNCRYTGAWANDLNEAIVGVSGSGNRLSIRDCSFRDHGSAFYVGGCSFDYLEVVDNEIIYTHGRASCGVGNVGYDHPCVGILGCGTTTVIRGNRFDGLEDGTFTGVDPGAPAGQKTPADGFFKGAGSTCSVMVVTENIVRNYGIEGILIEQYPVAEVECVVSRNTMSASPVKSGFFYDTQPAIVIAAMPGALVESNYINGSAAGIVVAAAAAPLTNRVIVRNNTILNVTAGINLLTASDDSVMEGNHVLCSSTFLRGQSGGVEAYTTPCHFNGINTSRGWVRNNTVISEEPDWDSTPTLVSRASNALTLDDATGIAAGGLLISKNGGVLSFFPVTSVAGNVVTCDASWSAAYPGVVSGVIYYENHRQGSFFLRGAITSDSNDTTRASGNLIIGGLQDFAFQNAAIITEWGNTFQDVGSQPTAYPAQIVRQGWTVVDGVYA